VNSFVESTKKLTIKIGSFLNEHNLLYTEINKKIEKKKRKGVVGATSE
jgi:hypothetical protein